jgi:hypothetical protein
MPQVSNHDWVSGVFGAPRCFRRGSPGMDFTLPRDQAALAVIQAKDQLAGFRPLKIVLNC